MDDHNRRLSRSFAQYPHQAIVYGHPCSLPPQHHHAATLRPCAADGSAAATRVNAATNNNPAAYYDDPADKKPFAKKDAALCCSAVFLIFLVYCIAGGIMAPMYNAKIEIDSALVSPFNFSSSQLYQKWDIGIFLRNPNRLASITYRDFSASLHYNLLYMTSSGIIASPVHLGPKQQAFQNVSISVFSRDVANSTASSIDSEIARGWVGFDLRLLLRIRYAGTMFSLPHEECVEAACDGVEIEFPANATTGAMLGGRKRCDKHRLSDCQ